MAHKPGVKIFRDGIYRGYIPIDLPQNRPPNRIKWWWKVLGKPKVTLYPKQPTHVGYSEQPEYPPLNDASKKGLKADVRHEWYDKLKSLPTVEEKLWEMSHHASHHMAFIHNWMPSCNSLPMAKYLTQTHLVDSLPDSYTQALEPQVTEPGRAQRLTDASREVTAMRVRAALLSQVNLEKYNSIRRGPRYVSKSVSDNNREAYYSDRLVQDIVNSVKKVLAIDANKQLLEYQYDLTPAIRSWWYHSGFEPPNNKVYYKSRKDDDGNINQMIQMDGHSALNIRGGGFIKPIVDMSDPIVTDKSLVPKYRHPLREFGARFHFARPVTLPGVWYDHHENLVFPHTSFLSMDCLRLKNGSSYTLPLDSAFDIDSLNSQAILTAFGWLNSLAVYHGFTTFHEIDYPFTCQVVTTDGQDWLFNVYQLNSHTFHRDLGGPQKNNICWSSGKLRLFEKSESGELLDINDTVVSLLIKFMSVQTSQDYTSSLNLCPHLGTDTRTEEERANMKHLLRCQFEQRRNHKLLHQWKVPLWEHIFFKSKEGRNRIRHMKPVWHPPKPKMPHIFE